MFGLVGLEIRKRQPILQPGVPRTSMPGALQQLVKLGLRPATVIDVGVAFETNALYEPFPDASLLLIEPLQEYEPFLQRICAKRKAQYVLAAAGPQAGTATLHVHADFAGSSFLREVEGAAVDGAPRQVPVVSVDEVCAEKGMRGPYLIKVDVQGAELQVLAGARRTLQETEAVILEVTLFGTMVGGPQAYDIVAQMKEYGFVLYDLYGFNYRPFDGALAQLDMVFVQENGRFRASHVFATPELRKEQFAAAQAEFAERGIAGR